jgi:aspartyl-tRNA(Asn)/glutamyl-tRNA(Gln) amidotransferase subunit B
MQNYHVVIGLEIHVQLNTKSKLFCSCANEYAPDEPNKNICPFCTGQPGALPLLNKAAVQKAIAFGVAVGATVPKKTRWDRKNYFYPDLPTGYQISQYDNPIVEGGNIDFFIENKESGAFEAANVQLTRAHLEADAAKLLHANGKTYVDFNRSGCPLIEIVTEPVIRSSNEAMAFVSELQLLVRTIGISDADMEKGQMRFDCNVSLQTEEQYGTNTLPSYRTETKNINSIRSLGRAIEYEMKRQQTLLEKGETPKQETRGWKDDLNRSDSQRSKEDAMDYRYFPEPDLPILEIQAQDIPQIQDLPKLPNQKRSTYQNMGLNIQTANTFVNQEETGIFFERVLDHSSNPHIAKPLANVITTNLLALSTKLEKSVSTLVSPDNLITLVTLLVEEKIHNQGLSTALEILVNNIETNALEVVEKHNLLQISDTGALQEIVDNVITNNQSVAQEYISGKTQVIGFLIGQCMKSSNGTGNPKKFTELLTEALSK